MLVANLKTFNSIRELENLLNVSRELPKTFNSIRELENLLNVSRELAKTF